MPRFYVAVREVATYGTWVEAEDADKARDLGEEAVADAITINPEAGVTLEGVDDRDVVRVETEEEYAR